MKTAFLALIAGAALWAASAYGDDFSQFPIVTAKSTRIEQIEKKFKCEFIEVVDLGIQNGKKYIYWSFRQAENSDPIGYIGFLAPVNARDDQVMDCMCSASFAHGYAVKSLKEIFLEYLQKQPKPDSTPTLYK